MTKSFDSIARRLSAYSIDKPAIEQVDVCTSLCWLSHLNGKFRSNRTAGLLHIHCFYIYKLLNSERGKFTPIYTHFDPAKGQPWIKPYILIYKAATRLELFSCNFSSFLFIFC